MEIVVYFLIAFAICLLIAWGVSEEIERCRPKRRK